MGKEMMPSPEKQAALEAALVEFAAFATAGPGRLWGKDWNACRALLAIIEREKQPDGRAPEYYDHSHDKRCIVCGESGGTSSWTSAIMAAYIHEACMFGEAGNETETKEILNDPSTMDALRRAEEQRDAGILILDSAVRPGAQAMDSGRVDPKRETAEGLLEAKVKELAALAGWANRETIDKLEAEALALMRAERERVERAIAVLRFPMGTACICSNVQDALRILEGREP